MELRRTRRCRRGSEPRRIEKISGGHRRGLKIPGETGVTVDRSLLLQEISRALEVLGPIDRDVTVHEETDETPHEESDEAPHEEIDGTALEETDGTTAEDTGRDHRVRAVGTGDRVMTGRETVEGLTGPRTTR